MWFLSLTCKVQRIFQIGAVKKLLQDKGGEQAVSVKVLKRHFDQNLEIKSGEAATEHMIQTAIALWNSLFSVPRLKVAWSKSMCVCQLCFDLNVHCNDTFIVSIDD